MGLRRAPRGKAGVSYPYSITSFSPASVTAGSGATVITVNGGVFPVGAQVYVDGVAQATTGTASTLTFTLPAPVVAVPGYKNIQVKTTVPATTSGSKLYPVNFPMPTLGTIAPTFAFLAAGNTTVTTPGTGFYNPGTFGRLDGVAIPFAYGSPTTGTVTVPAATVNLAGDHTISLSNLTPGGGQSVDRVFQVRYRTPAITSLSPTIIPIDSGDFLLTVNDTSGRFYNAADWPLGGTEVLIDDVPGVVTFVSATQIKVTVPAAVTSSPGIKVIKVRNPTAGGGGGTSVGTNVSVSAPTTTALSCSSRPKGYDGFLQRVSGTQFVSTDTVLWNGVPLVTTFVNGTTLDAAVTTTNLGVSGPVAISVLTIDGYETNAQSFTVIDWDFDRLGTTLRLWLDGSDASAVNDGFGRVQTWTDRSTWHHNFIQNVAASRGYRVAAAALLNGQPGVAFFGTDPDFYNGPVNWIVNVDDGIITKTNYTVWVVGGANAGDQVNANPSIMGEPGPYVNFGNLGNNQIQGQDDSTIVTNPVVWTGGPFVIRARKSGGLFYQRVNRGAELSAASAATYAPATVLLGYGRSGNWYFTGVVGLILACDSQVNITHNQQVANILSYRFNTSYGTPGSLAVPSTATPNTCEQYALPFDIVLTGTGFIMGVSVANLDEFVCATNVTSTTQMTVTIDTSALQTYGKKYLTVTNPDRISAPLLFNVTQYIPSGGPNLTGISPTGTARYEDELILTCTGANYSLTSQVYAGAVALATQFIGPTILKATIPASVLYTAGVKSITVKDGASTSGSQNFTVTNWTIASIVGLTAWYRADTVVTSGSSVTQWTDLSGNGRHLLQATGSAQPQLIPSDARFNGQPSIDFNGTSHFLAATGQNASVQLTNTAWTVLGVYSFDAITGSGAITAPYANNTVCGLTGSGYFSMTGHNAAPPELWAASNDGSAYKVAIDNHLVANTAQYAMFRRAAGVNYIAIGRNTESSIAQPTPPNMSTQNFTVGSGLGGNFLNGQVPEVFTVGGNTITTTEQRRVKNYLQDRYGIAA